MQYNTVVKKRLHEMYVTILYLHAYLQKCIAATQNKITNWM